VESSAVTIYRTTYSPTGAVITIESVFLDGLAQADVRSRPFWQGLYTVFTGSSRLISLFWITSSPLREEVPRKSRKPSARKDRRICRRIRLEEFLSQHERLTLLGYYTSEIGWTQELGRLLFHFGPLSGLYRGHLGKGNSGN